MFFSVAALSLLASAVVADQTFEAVVFRDRTKFINSTISVHDGDVHVGDGESNIKWVLKENGNLYDANSKKYFVWDDKTHRLATADEPKDQFSIYQGWHLSAKGGSSGFSICEDGDNKVRIATGYCNPETKDQGTIALINLLDIKAISPDDEGPDNKQGQNSQSSSSSSSGSSATGAGETHVVPQDQQQSSTPAVPQVEGVIEGAANANKLGVAMGALGVVAALL
ncbi:hypothetical protein DIURU_000327 [Diutina rugosa]|uniref:Cell wall protein n=1 Tax=Diutina rugosa TaxID=5481 RepID=A0A642UYM0_DIURU|nr:uncharacterized protein DIURU_000327 [Diutina rugosa]KAA8907917.1 hypothetical protein DIURU_000327 [Diutina rugosa]